MLYLCEVGAEHRRLAGLFHMMSIMLVSSRICELLTVVVLSREAPTKNESYVRESVLQLGFLLVFVAALE